MQILRTESSALLALAFFAKFGAQSGNQSAVAGDNLIVIVIDSQHDEAPGVSCVPPETSQ
jgi:hypothetical protein